MRAAAHNMKQVLGLICRQNSFRLLKPADWLAIGFDDDIPRREPRMLRRAALLNIRDADA